MTPSVRRVTLSGDAAVVAVHNQDREIVTVSQDITAAPEAVFAQEVTKLREMGIKPKEQLTLEPFERDHAMVVGVYQRSQ